MVVSYVSNAQKNIFNPFQFLNCDCCFPQTRNFVWAKNCESLDKTCVQQVFNFQLSSLWCNIGTVNRWSNFKRRRKNQYQEYSNGELIQNGKYKCFPWIFLAHLLALNGCGSRKTFCVKQTKEVHYTGKVTKWFQKSDFRK